MHADHHLIVVLLTCIVELGTLAVGSLVFPRSTLNQSSQLPTVNTQYNIIATNSVSNKMQYPSKFQKKNHRPWKGTSPNVFASDQQRMQNGGHGNSRGAEICGVRSTQLMMRKLGSGGNSRQARIIGGTEVFYGEEPWQADIRLFRGDQFEHICGGAIISNHLIVTAAHCVQISQPSNLRVFIGSHLLKERDPFEHSFRIERILTHPDFQRVKPYSNDIALVRLLANTLSGITFNEHVRPICLPTTAPPSRPMPDGHHQQQSRIIAGMRCSVSGWGQENADDTSGGMSSVLRSASVPILSQEECAKANGVIRESMLCAGYLRGGVDACHGDSGGPLSCEINGISYLAGIVSWGDRCAAKNKPGVYTRIESFGDWIEKGIRELTPYYT